MDNNNEVKYPDLTVQLTGQDGNAFVLLGIMRKALRRAGVSHETVEEFTDEAREGDYDHLLQTCMKWVNVE